MKRGNPGAKQHKSPDFERGMVLNMQQNIEKDNLKRREKRQKRFMIISGVVLFVLAAMLFVGKSEYGQNQLALLKSDADYYCYVEQKNIQSLNEIVISYYESLLKEYKKSEILHTTEQVSVQIAAKALLAALLEPYGIGTEANLELFIIRQGEQAAVMGEAVAAGTAYPIEALYDGKDKCYLFLPQDNAYYHLTLEQGKGLETSFIERLASKESLKGSRLKKLLAKYEKLFFEGVSRENMTLKKKVLCSVNEHSAYQKELTISLTAEVLQNIVRDMFAALLEDTDVHGLYEDCKSADMLEYKAYLEGLQQELFAEDSFLGVIDSAEMKLYVDNYGRVTGRDIVLRTKDTNYRIGYASVANGLSVGLEAYVQVDDKELFFADAVCKVDDGAVEGELSVFLPIGGEMQEYHLTLQDVKIIDLITGRFSGDIFISSNHWQGFDLHLSMSATNLQQEILLSAYYGGAEQMNLSVRVQETDPKELPEVPEQSTEIDGWGTDLLH